MAAMQNVEVGVTLAPLNVRSWKFL